MATVTVPADLTPLQQAALRLAMKPTKSFVAFARALYAAHRENRTFLNTVERDAEISRRALFYLLNVGEFLLDYSVSDTDAERIGWTKLQIVARHVGGDTKVGKRMIQRYLTIAEHTTAHRLPAALNNQDADRTVASRAVLLRIPADAYPALENALLAHGAEKQGRGLVGKEVAIMALVQSVTASDRT